MNVTDECAYLARNYLIITVIIFVIFVTGIIWSCMEGRKDMNKGGYCYSFDDRDEFTEEIFRTAKQAIDAAAKDPERKDRNYVRIGKFEPYEVHANIQDIMLDIEIDACESCGDSADDLTLIVDRPDAIDGLAELDTKVNNLITRYLKKFNLYPTLYVLVNETDIDLNTGKIVG